MAGRRACALRAVGRVSSLGAGWAVHSRCNLRISDRVSSLGGAVALYWKNSRDPDGPKRRRHGRRSEDRPSCRPRDRLMRRGIAARRTAARMNAKAAALPPMCQVGSIKCRQLLVAELWQRTGLRHFPARGRVLQVVDGTKPLVVPLVAHGACGCRHE